MNRHDVVELVKVHGWPEGTYGTVVDELADDTYLIEVADENGRTLDLIPVNYDAGRNPTIRPRP